MDELTGKVRLLRLQRAEPSDRVPVSPRVLPNYALESDGATGENYVAGSPEFARHFGCDIMDWTCTVPWNTVKLNGPNWEPTVRTEVSGKITHEIVTVAAPQRGTGRW